MAVNNATLAKEIDGVIEYLYPKTTAELVEYDENLTVKDKINKIDDSINTVNDRVTTITDFFNGYKTSNANYSISIENANEENNNSILNMVYPIGSIYLNANNINPKYFFGGTWKLLGSNKIYTDSGTNNENFEESGITGGESTNNNSSEYTMCYIWERTI